MVSADDDTVAAARGRVVGAWDDLWVDPAARLHPNLHPRAELAPGRLIRLARLVGLGLVDVQVAMSSRHAGPGWVLVALAVIAKSRP